MRIVVKVGGATLENSILLSRTAMAVRQLAEQHHVVLIHGGGIALTRIMHQMGKESQFIDGMRVTDADTRDLAVMVLAGYVNKKLVAALIAARQQAVGLCGSDGLVFRVRKKEPNGHDFGYVGEVSAVDSRWIEVIWQNNCVPVLSSIGLGVDGQYYNTNADQLASACAAACHADALIFLTDVPGVRDADGLVIRWLSLPRLRELSGNAVIYGGMLPKLDACKQALLKGVSRVKILPADRVEAVAEVYFSKLEFGTEVLIA